MTPEWSRLLLVALLLVLFGVVIGGPLGSVVQDGGPVANEPASNVTVTFVDQSGAELGQITGPVADDGDERYTGLSETESLAPNGGMIFAYDDEATRAYVMRNMSFPLDIIFVGEDGTITEIYHAETDDDRNFTGTARWVIETNRGYTEAHNVSVGDEVTGLPR